MMHKPIFLKHISLSFLKKNCFEDFSSTIYFGNRIAIIGRNGSGKSSILKILCQSLSPSSGEVLIPDGLCVGYVEQIITDLNDFSGGQRFNKRLSEVLNLSPDLLLLDEPTNHLDQDNRKGLIQMLQSYQGTLITVSHDTELLRRCTHILWHIDNNRIYEFSGVYDDYIREIQKKRVSIEKELSFLAHQKKEMHHALMKEQKRAAKSKLKGQKSIDQRKWSTVVSKAKALRAEQTSGKKKLAINKKKQNLIDQLTDLKSPEIILPKFSLTSANIGSGSILSISDANIGYSQDKIVLRNISLTVYGKERIAICGKNASGKSTLLKAILGRKQVFKTGSWQLPCPEHIGYLDQHYSELDPKLSVIDHVCNLRTGSDNVTVRRHLNDFLFRKNEEVIRLTEDLSGG